MGVSALPTVSVGRDTVPVNEVVLSRPQVLDAHGVEVNKPNTEISSPVLNIDQVTSLRCNPDHDEVVCTSEEA